MQVYEFILTTLPVPALTGASLEAHQYHLHDLQGKQR